MDNYTIDHRLKNHNITTGHLEGNKVLPLGLIYKEDHLKSNMTLKTNTTLNTRANTLAHNTFRNIGKNLICYKMNRFIDTIHKGSRNDKSTMAPSTFRSNNYILVDIAPN